MRIRSRLQIQAELPAAIFAFWRLRWAVQTQRLNTRIHGASESLKLHGADGLAREIWEPLAPPGFLDPANIHEEPQACAVFRPLGPLRVDQAVLPQAQSPFQRSQAARRGNAERRHNAVGLGRREPLPCLRVQCDSGIHTKTFLRRQKPATVMGQPALGEHLERQQQLLASHRVKRGLARLDRTFRCVRHLILLKVASRHFQLLPSPTLLSLSPIISFADESWLTFATAWTSGCGAVSYTHLT